MKKGETISITIRGMHEEDLPAVAQVHKHAYLRDHTTAHLPERLLRALYSEYLDSGAWCYVAVADGRVVGLLVGGPVPTASRTFMRRHRWALIAAVLRTPRLWPMVLRRVVRSARSWRRVRRVSSDSPTPPHLSLVSIAVRPTYQGTGAARALVHAFERDVRAAGHKEYLTWVHLNNIRSHQFFVSLGARVRYTSAATVCFSVALSPDPTRKSV